MSLGSRGMSSISAEKCFRAWIEYGTVKRALQALTEQGITGRNGKPMHYNTLRRGTFVYILEEPEKAREALREKKVPFTFDDDLWDDYRINKAKHVILVGRGPKAFYGWLVGNNLVEQAIRFGHLPPGYDVDSTI